MTWLYVLRDDRGKVLYVGMTGSPRRRFAEHRRRSAWWKEVASASLRPFATRSEARAAEHKEIGRLDPEHNVMRIATWSAMVTAALARAKESAA